METSNWRRVGMMANYFAICMLCIMLQVLPIGLGSFPVPGPDLILAFTLCWSVRRPELMPPILIAATLLLADLLLERPPGLYALIALCAAIYLQIRARDLRQALFPIEFLYVALAIVAIGLTYLIFRKILILPHQSFVQTGLQSLITIAIYPIVAFVSGTFFGISRQNPASNL